MAGWGKKGAFCQLVDEKPNPSTSKRRYVNEKQWEQWMRETFVQHLKLTYEKMPSSNLHLPDRYVGHGNWMEVKLVHHGGYLLDTDGKPIKEYKNNVFVGLSKQQKIKCSKLHNKGDQVWINVRIISTQVAFSCIIPWGKLYDEIRRVSNYRQYTIAKLMKDKRFWIVECREQLERMLETDFLPYYDDHEAYLKWKPGQ